MNYVHVKAILNHASGHIKNPLSIQKCEKAWDVIQNLNFVAMSFQISLILSSTTHFLKFKNFIDREGHYYLIWIP